MSTHVQITAILISQWAKLLLGLAVALLLVMGLRTPALVSLLQNYDVPQQVLIADINLFSMGFQSWLSAWFLFQMYQLFKHRFFGATSDEVPLTNAFDKPVLVVALLMSAFSWYGILVGVVPAFTREPLSNAATVMGLLVGSAGTALYVFLGMLLNRIKPGYGFWLLLLLQALYNAGTGLVSAVIVLGDGTVSRNALLLTAALLLCSVLVATVMLRPRLPAHNAAPRDIFTLCLLGASLAMIVAPAIYLALDWLAPTYAAVDATSLQGVVVGLMVSAIEILSLLIAAWLMFGGIKMMLACWDIVVGVVLMTVVTELTYQIGTGIWPGFWPLHFVLLAWAARQLRDAFHSVQKPLPIIVADDEELFDKDFRRGWR